VDLAWRGYEDEQTQFIPYWDSAKWFEVETTGVLASLYLKRDRALLAVGNQRDQAADCRLGLARVLRLLPRAVRARDAVTGGALDLERGRLRFELPARGWRLVELSVP
jgi:hypothetical protein